MLKNKLSVVILTHNNGKGVVPTIKSVQNIADEIIAIDDDSGHETTSILKKFKVKIYKRSLEGNYSEQRNFALSKTKNVWVLFLDSDETVSDSLGKEILSKIKEKGVSGFLISRVDIFNNKKLMFGEAGNTKLLRLAKKDSGSWRRAVHEYWDVKGKILTLKNHIDHKPHPSISAFIESINKYSLLHSLENEKEGKKPSLAKVIFWPIGKFFYYWIIKLGFLDGVEGFIYAVFMSFHSFLAWGTLWIKENN